MRKITDYTWHTGKLEKPMRLLVVSDLHNSEYEDILPHLQDADVLLLPGDVVISYWQSYLRGLAFLKEAAQIIPTYVGMGNHEARLREFDAYVQGVEESGAKFLLNTYERLGNLLIGCWFHPRRRMQVDMLPAFQMEEGCRVLMCHRPEDYVHYLRDADVDLVLSGHAHGGQIRLFNRGLYSPGQGIFPKYTRGVVDRMIISAGVGNTVPMPRWNNPCEILRIELD